MISLEGKRALVTGGSAGIGRAIAQRLCAAGVRTVIAARRALVLETVAAETGAHPVAIDLSSDAAARELAAAAQAHLGGVDILVLSSGVHLAGKILDGNSPAFSDMLRTNVTTPLELARACMPALEAARGDVVFINSSVTRAANISGRALFASGNHALRALADGLRDEVNERGVRVASIYPGKTATDRIARVMADAGAVYTPETLLQPEDVADAVIGLLSLNATAEVTDLYVRPRLKH